MTTKILLNSDTLATEIQALLDTPSKVVILRLKKEGFKPLKTTDSKKALREIEKDLLRWSKLVLNVVNDSMPKETEKLNPEVDLEEAEKEEVIPSMFKPMSPTRVNELATSSSKRVARLLGEQVNSQISRANRIAQEGLKRGDNLNAVTKRIEKSTGFTEGVANRFARTTTMSMLNQGLDELYQDNRDSILGVRHISTLDSRTCMVCGSLDGKEYYQGTSEKGEKTGGSDEFNDRPSLPIHASCRCVYIPISRFWLRAMIATGQKVSASNLRASSFGAEEKLDWNGWLKKTDKSDSKTVQSILGSNRYKLWKNNGVPPEKFINSRLQIVPVDRLLQELVSDNLIKPKTFSELYSDPLTKKEILDRVSKNHDQALENTFERDKAAVKKIEERNFNVSPDALWIIRANKLDPEDIAASFYMGETSRFSFSKENSTTIKVKVNSSFGYMTRYIDFKAKTVDHYLFSIDEKEQSGGRGKSLLKKSILLYEKLGIKKIKVHAALSVGAYVWARTGFQPPPSTLNSLKKALSNSFSKTLVDKNLSKTLEKGVSSVNSISELASLKVSSEFSQSIDMEALNKKIDYRHQKKTGETIEDWLDRKGFRDQNGDLKIGKMYLLGKSWKGSVNPQDKENWNHYRMYVGAGAKE